MALEDIIKAAVDQATETGEVPDVVGSEGQNDDGGSNDEGGTSEGDQTDDGGNDGGDSGSDGGNGSGGGQQVEGDEGQGAEGDQGADQQAAAGNNKGGWSDEDKGILKDLGINTPTGAVARNKLPYERSLHTLVNTVKKERARLADAHGKAISEHTAKLAAAEADLKRLQDFDIMAQRDTDKYVGIMATLYPETWGKYAGKGQQPVEKKEVTSDRPKPDVQFPDGSVGYSPEQLDKLLEWNASQAEARALKAAEAALKPVQDREKLAQGAQAKVNEFRQNIVTAKATFGAEFYDKHEVEVAKALNEENAKARAENRVPAPFMVTVGKTLMGIKQLEVTQARENALKELKAAPKAASNGGQGASQRKRDTSSELSLDDDIRARLDKTYGINR